MSFRMKKNDNFDWFIVMLKDLSSDNLNTIAERNLEIYDILIQIKERKRETL